MSFSMILLLGTLAALLLWGIVLFNRLVSLLSLIHISEPTRPY